MFHVLQVIDLPERKIVLTDLLCTRFINVRYKKEIEVNLVFYLISFLLYFCVTSKLIEILQTTDIIFTYVTIEVGRLYTTFHIPSA